MFSSMLTEPRLRADYSLPLPYNHSTGGFWCQSFALKIFQKNEKKVLTFGGGSGNISPALSDSAKLNKMREWWNW